MSARAVALCTHGRPQQVAGVLERLLAAAAASGVQLRLDRAEAAKHGLDGHACVAVTERAGPDAVELCVVLGGDGTILRGLRRYARSGVPVFAVNFGEIGFLATLEPAELDGFGFERAFAGDFEVLELPAIGFDAAGAAHVAVNDVSFHRQVGGRVAQLCYGVEGQEVGSVRCDGLVVCTPAGSTGYNLANGGPVLAWGVGGYGVSFIAPHSLTARALVVAPDDTLTVSNRGREPVDVVVDGHEACEIAPGEELRVRYEARATALAQLHGSTFYRRLRDKFGRLA